MVSKARNDPNTNSHFASPSHTSIQMSSQLPSTSMAQTSASQADLPYRSPAPFGVLSKYRDSLDLIFPQLCLHRIHSQMFDSSNSTYLSGSMAPLQTFSSAAQLDMNISCLFMHEVNSRLIVSSTSF